jgi:DNA repair ATPase RecN
MKLKIKNFRGIDKREVEIPSQGMVNFSGESEAGKTSLMESIVWAFYGTDGTKNVTPLDGGKKTNIELSFKDLNIKRTKGPNSLEVNGVLDEAAQGVIDSTVSCVDHFKLGSYVQQKMKNCFLNLTPKAQLDFLDKLAFDVDIDSIKRRSILC